MMQPRARRVLITGLAVSGAVMVAAGILFFALDRSPLIGGVLFAAGALDLLLALFFARGS